MYPHYERVGLMKYFGMKSADQLDEKQLIQDLDTTPVDLGALAAE